MKVLRLTLPTRREQEAYHRALEEKLGIKIFKMMGRWQWQKPK